MCRHLFSTSDTDGQFRTCHSDCRGFCVIEFTPELRHCSVTRPNWAWLPSQLNFTALFGKLRMAIDKHSVSDWPSVTASSFFYSTGWMHSFSVDNHNLQVRPQQKKQAFIPVGAELPLLCRFGECAIYMRIKRGICPFRATAATWRWPRFANLPFTSCEDFMQPWDAHGKHHFLCTSVWELPMQQIWQQPWWGWVDNCDHTKSKTCKKTILHYAGTHKP
jgi:hypothetical protein